MPSHWVAPVDIWAKFRAGSPARTYRAAIYIALIGSWAVVCSLSTLGWASPTAQPQKNEGTGQAKQNKTTSPSLAYPPRPAPVCWVAACATTYRCLRPVHRPPLLLRVRFFSSPQLSRTSSQVSSLRPRRPPLRPEEGGGRR